MGRQCRLCRIGAICLDLGEKVRTLAAAFCTRCSFCTEDLHRSRRSECECVDKCLTSLYADVRPDFENVR